MLPVFMQINLLQHFFLEQGNNLWANIIDLIAFHFDSRYCMIWRDQWKFIKLHYIMGGPIQW